MPVARSKPPVPPNPTLLFAHNATALLAHGAEIRQNIRLRIGRRAHSDSLLAKSNTTTSDRMRLDRHLIVDVAALTRTAKLQPAHDTKTR